MVASDKLPGVGCGKDATLIWWTARPSACRTRLRTKQTIRSRRARQPGVGFPLAAHGGIAVAGHGHGQRHGHGAYAGKETGELALLRQLLDWLEPDAVLVADRYYCSYFMIAMLLELGIDFVARLEDDLEAPKKDSPHEGGRGRFAS